MKRIVFPAALLLAITAQVFAQVDIDKAVNLSGSGPNAKISGIKTVDDGKDAVNAESVQKGTLVYADATNIGNDYSVTLTPAVTAYTKGMAVSFKASAANSGASGLSVNGLPVAAIKKNVSADLAGGDILSGQLITVTYDGTNFQMMNGAQGPQGATGLLPNGSAAGNTPYWSGAAWVVNSSNIYNNGGNVGVNNTSPSNLLTVGNTPGQSNALIAARFGGNGIEFGHGNAAGFGSTIGAQSGGGQPFIALNAEAGTNSNTYRTRGLAGTVIVGDLAGGLSINSVTGTNADNQSLTPRVILSSSGNLGVGVSPPAKLTVLQSENAAQSVFTQDVSAAGLLITTNFTTDAYTPGVFWNTTNNNAAKPKAGIYLKENGGGTWMHFGTSVNFSTGITNTGILINPSGQVGIGNVNPLFQLDVINQARLGNVETGLWPANTAYAYWGHEALDHSTPGNYAMLQSSDGVTYINAATGKPINFREGNADKMVLTGGKLGIATTVTPTERLDLGTNGNMVMRVDPGSDAASALINISMYARFNSGTQNLWNIYTAPIGGGFGVPANSLSFWQYPGNGLPGCCLHRFTLFPSVSGQSGATAYIDGNGNMIATSFVPASDITLKKDIEYIEEKDYAYYMQQIRDAKSIRFRYINESATFESSKALRVHPHIGVSAQSLPAALTVALPVDLDGKPAEGKLGVSLPDMNGLMLAGIKALDKRQQDTDELIKTQQKLIEELTRKIDMLENKQGR